MECRGRQTRAVPPRCRVSAPLFTCDRKGLLPRELSLSLLAWALLLEEFLGVASIITGPGLAPALLNWEALGRSLKLSNPQFLPCSKI